MIESLVKKLEKRVNEAEGGTEEINDDEYVYILNELYLQITLRGTQHIEDAGPRIVRDEIDLLMRTNPEMIRDNPFQEGDEGSCGFSLKVNIKDVEFDTYIFFYDPQPACEVMQIFNMGVQEAHALYHFKKTDFFREAMTHAFSYSKLPENLQVLPQELVGQLGGIYATRVYSELVKETNIMEVIVNKEDNVSHLNEFNEAMKLLGLYE